MNLTTDMVNLAHTRDHEDSLIWRQHMPTGEHYNKLIQEYTLRSEKE
jgi:hypothetical protein